MYFLMGFKDILNPRRMKLYDWMLLIGFISIITTEVTAQEDERFTRNGSHIYYGNDAILREGSMKPPTGLRTWIDKDTTLPSGVLETFTIFIHPLDVSLDYGLRLQIWRLVPKSFQNYALLWEKRVDFDTNWKSTTGTRLTFTGDNLWVEKGDFIGWTCEGERGLISYNNDASRATYFRSHYGKFPAVGQSLTFNAYPESKVFSIGVEIIPEACSNNTYGYDCLNTCPNCKAGCDPVDGTCNEGCKSGWTGGKCDLVCSDRTWGPGCQNKCGHCRTNCHYDSGSCGSDCMKGWTGDSCIEDVDECVTSPCEPGGACNNTPGSFICSCYEGYVQSWNGLSCQDVDECINYPCSTGGACINSQGSFQCACYDGYITTTNDVQDCKECHNHTYGENCNSNCSVNCAGEGRCNHVTGTCDEGCSNGWRGDTCDADVDKCISNPCSPGGACINSQGSFQCACYDGYITTTNDVQDCIECPQNTYGQGCNTTCGHCKGGCSTTNGSCLDGCETGWTGRLCTEQVAISSAINDVSLVLSIVIGCSTAGALIIILTVILLICRLKKKPNGQYIFTQQDGQQTDSNSLKPGLDRVYESNRTYQNAESGYDEIQVQHPVSPIYNTPYEYGNSRPNVLPPGDNTSHVPHSNTERTVDDSTSSHDGGLAHSYSYPERIDTTNNTSGDHYERNQSFEGPSNRNYEGLTNHYLYPDGYENAQQSHDEQIVEPYEKPYIEVIEPKEYEKLKKKGHQGQGQSNNYERNQSFEDPSNRNYEGLTNHYLYPDGYENEPHSHDGTISGTYEKPYIEVIETNEYEKIKEEGCQGQGQSSSPTQPDHSYLEVIG